jgi:hypothetical protein
MKVVAVGRVFACLGMFATTWAVGCGSSGSSSGDNPNQVPGGAGTSGSEEEECRFDSDEDGYCDDGYPELDQAGDCNDDDANIHPGAAEAANAIDDDCNGLIDDGVTAACALTLEEPAAGCETATQLVAGRAHACLLTDAGRVLCWGRNDGGALGTPDVVNSPVPLAVPGIEGATALAVTGSAMCALAGANAICWGGGAAYPFTLALPPNTTQIAIASTTDQGGQVRHYLYALDHDGAFFQRAFFAEAEAAPAAGTIGTEFVKGGSGVKQLVAGGGPMCAITDAGALECFNADPPTIIAPAPVDFAAMSSTGRLCYKTGGELYCSSTIAAGTEVPGNGSAIGVAISDRFNCAFNEAGKVGCWANDGPTTIGDAAGLAVGSDFGCVQRKSGKISCWGSADGGMLGDGRTKPSIREMEPVDVAAAPTLELPAVVLLGSSALGACDSLNDLSTLVMRSPQIHAAVAACKADCANRLDAAECFSSCANVPGLSAACLGCYTALATCQGADCYAAFIGCAGYAVDFARAVYNQPRFQCAGANCLHGASVGQPCASGADCITGACSKLAHSGDALVCAASDGASCSEGSPYCQCDLGDDGFGVSYSGYCGGCYGEGRIASAQGDCFRDCSQENYCAQGQMCRYFSSGSDRYCD